ncbi:putative ATP-dependent RNA helicase Dbp73D [Leptinotarsa decemlineata]|uniref:putative ATP-dependent RNA helicase Dbp73D n=1 Tax=Leptinotarsa decemlineata TaxID=7539 RepID=UPI000C253E4A|nr:probable ATP-dependent RNA helicase Dbp73D [Leptinotarsa decemlineata]
MELFVVNRHEGDEPKETIEDDEKAKLDRILKKIDRNKKLRQRQKEKQNFIAAKQRETAESRQIRRQIKASIVPVPENKNEEFIDEDVKEHIEEGNEEIEGDADKSPKKKPKLDLKDLEGFTILGADSFARKSKVKRILPNWLANPTVISVNLQNLQTKVSDIKLLDKGIRKLLKANGVEYFFPVQAEVIPWLLTSIKNTDVMFPRDICVSAPTGSGKTLAFALPVIQALKKYTVKKIRALVILPTQDLALQVFKTFKIYSQNTSIDICLVTGSNSFAVEQSQLISDNKAFGSLTKADILVCTAGRLVDHLKLTKGFSLANLEFIIIDEADRVLENVQNDWLYHLEKHIHQEESNSQTGRLLNLSTLQKPRPPQKLLFSATLSQDPEKLQKLSLFQPKLFTSVVENVEDSISTDKPSMDTFIGKYTTPSELTEKYIATSLELKPLFLYKFIKLEKLTKSLVFTHSVDSAHRLAILLRALFGNDLKVEETSSNLQGKSRKQLIEKFCSGKIDILVCTDALARGIDLPGVQCVISYSAPRYLKTYIHRAGRTARAGEPGLAVTLLNKTQISKFKGMLSQANKSNIEELTIPEDDLEPLGEKYKESLQELKKIVDKEEKLDLERTLSAKGSKKRKRKNSISSSISK